MAQEEDNITPTKYVAMRIQYGCQTNLDESSHAIEKLRKYAEKVEFEDERYIEIIMELVQKVDKSRELIKDKDILINHLERKVKDIGEEKYRIEAIFEKKCKIWII